MTPYCTGPTLRASFPQTALEWNDQTSMVYRLGFVRLPDGMTLQDLNDRPNVWQNVQNNANKALRKWDQIRCVAFDEANHVTADAKEAVSGVLDKNAGPVFTRLCQIALGRKIRLGAGPNATTVYPSETSQMKAIEILARKLRPDLSAVEQTVDQTVREEGSTDSRTYARAVLSLLREAELEAAPDMEPAQLAPPARETEPDGTLEHAAPQEPPANPKPDYVYFETDAETVFHDFWGPKWEAPMEDQAEVIKRIVQEDAEFDAHMDVEAKATAHALIQGYLGPDHKVTNMQSFYSALVQALKAARVKGQADRAGADIVSL